MSRIEERPRTVRELRELTGMTFSAIYEALREYQALGILKGTRQRIFGRGHAAPKVYALLSRTEMRPCA